MKKSSIKNIRISIDYEGFNFFNSLNMFFKGGWLNGHLILTGHF